MVHGHPGRILAGLSARADLIVLGRHAAHHGPGAVTHAVLNHAHGPIVTVPSSSAEMRAGRGQPLTRRMWPPAPRAGRPELGTCGHGSPHAGPLRLRRGVAAVNPVGPPVVGESRANSLGGTQGNSGSGTTTRSVQKGAFNMSVTDQGSPTLAADELDALDAWWRAANYLSVGQIYLLGNPLLTEPLRPEHIKPRLLGHWGTTPGLNMLYVHLNRVIRNQDLNVIYVTGPGHGGPGIVANTYLEGTYSELYPHITPDAAGMGRLFKQFSFPGGIPSHVAPETPGSIHEGGELGYSLVHAYGAAFDNPDLIVACVIGDGESETGPLAGSWHSNKFLDPARDGAVLPILHLNGYKIANPTVPARIPHSELESLLRGYGYAVHTVEGDDPKLVHQQLAGTLDAVIEEIRADPAARPGRGRPVAAGLAGHRAEDAQGLDRAQGGGRAAGGGDVAGAPGPARRGPDQPGAPGPAREVDALVPGRGTVRRRGQAGARAGAARARGRPADEREPARQRRPAAARAGAARLPGLRRGGPQARGRPAEATRVLGTWLRDVIKANPSNFRLMGPDETSSNRLDAVFEATHRVVRRRDHPRRQPPGARTGG